MRDYIAGILTALVFLALYFVVPSMFSQFEELGTSVPKSLVIVFALSNMFVKYFYVLLPILFFSLRFAIGLVLPDNGNPTNDDAED